MSEELQATEWIGFGTGLLQRRDALSDDHPESWPSLWLKKYGVPMPIWAREQLGLPVPEIVCPKCGHGFCYTDGQKIKEIPS